MTGDMVKARVYDTYLTGRTSRLAPETLAGLKLRAPYLRAIIRRHFPADRAARVLDLGCGHGAFLHFMHEAGFASAWGVDGSREQVAEAERLGIGGVRHGDLAQTLQLTAAASLDVVTMFDVLEHFTRAEIAVLVTDIARVLKPGGRLILHVPNGESPFGGRIRYWDLTHEIAFTRESVSQLLLGDGFDAVRCYEDRPVVHGVFSACRNLAWRGIRGLLRAYLAVETGSSEPHAVFTQNFLVVADRRGAAATETMA